MSGIPWGFVWTLLVLSLVVVLAVCIVRLVRSFIRMAVATSDLLGTSAILDSVEATRDLDRPVVAVLQELEHIRAHFEERMTRRANRKRSRAEARLLRAKVITNVDATQRMWPRAW
jgi:hypothetical protein